MGYRTFIISYWLLLAWLTALPTGQTQTVPDFPYFNETTLRLYQARDWKALIPVAREAIDSGFDYYYLRLRLGGAYYELRRYRLAAIQFQEALRFNPGDPYAREMWQYALLLGGQPEAAYLVQAEDKAGFHFRSAQIEGGWKQSDQRTPVDDLYYFNFGFRHTLGRHLQVTHQYQQVFQRFVYLLEDDDPGQGPGGPPNPSYRRIEQQVDQHEYYLGPVFQFNRSWTLAGGFRQIWVQDTIGHYGEQAYALSITKAWPHLALTASGGYGRFGQQGHWQYGIGGTIYPLANTNWYYSGNVIMKTAAASDTFTRSPYWIAQRMGFRIAPNLWMEGQYAFGDIDRFSEYDAALTYNFYDRFRERFGGGIQYWIKGKHLLYFNYLREKKTWNEDGVTSFHHQVLLGGLQISF